jgi:hypothetical protein
MIDNRASAIKQYIIEHKTYYQESLSMKIEYKQFQDYSDRFVGIRFLEFSIQEDLWYVNR